MIATALTIWYFSMILPVLKFLYTKFSRMLEKDHYRNFRCLDYKNYRGEDRVMAFVGATFSALFWPIALALFVLWTWVNSSNHKEDLRERVADHIKDLEKELNIR